MDIAPNQILLYLQAENPDQDDEVLRSRSIWLCLACETCHSRCPKEVNLSVIMDFMRQESARQKKVHPEARDIVAFHEAFLDSIRANGRLHEAGLIAGYKFKTFHLLQDVLLAPKMFRRGKLGIFPDGVRNKAAIKRIFERAAALDDGLDGEQE